MIEVLESFTDPKVVRTLAKAGNIGLMTAALTTSLDVSFLSDPAGFADLIDHVGGNWEILGGFVTDEGTGF